MYTGFLYSAGAVHLVPAPASDTTAAGTLAYGVSDNGDVAGVTFTSVGGYAGPDRAFRYSGGVTTDISGLSKSDIDDSDDAYDVNDDGLFVGALDGEPAKLSGPTWTILGALPGTGGGAAVAVNDAGVIVGFSSGHAFVYSKGALQDLNSLVVLPKGTVLTYAVGVNASGQIAVDGTVDGHTHTFVLTPAVRTMPVTDLHASADAFVRNGAYADTNYGFATPLLVKQAVAPYDRVAYVTFNLGGILAASVSGASLELYGSVHNGTAPLSVEVHAVTAGSISESMITFRNAPLVGPDLASATILGSTPRGYEFNVSSYVKQALAEGKKQVTLAITGVTDTREVFEFNSREAASDQPQLVLGTLATVGKLAGHGTTVSTDAGSELSGYIGDIVGDTLAGIDVSDVSVDWGDGTVPSAGTAVYNPTTGNIDVDGRHEYRNKGRYVITITVDDQGVMSTIKSGAVVT